MLNVPQGLKMTNQESLTKALKIAGDNGFDRSAIASWQKHIFLGDEEETIRRFAPILIFNHDFAKALWGNRTKDMGGTPRLLAHWQYHQQQMVIADDPIKYLAANI